MCVCVCFQGSRDTKSKSFVGETDFFLEIVYDHKHSIQSTESFVDVIGSQRLVVVLLIKLIQIIT